MEDVVENCGAADGSGGAGEEDGGFLCNGIDVEYIVTA